MFDKRRRIDASVAITTINAKSIEKQVAVSAADLLKNVPGVYVNSSLGKTKIWFRRKWLLRLLSC